jgi:hypothetical protein
MGSVRQLGNQHGFLVSFFSGSQSQYHQPPENGGYASGLPGNQLLMKYQHSAQHGDDQIHPDVPLKDDVSNAAVGELLVVLGWNRRRGRRADATPAETS